MSFTWPLVEDIFLGEGISVVKIKITAICDSLNIDFQFICTFTRECIIVKRGLAVLKEEAFGTNTSECRQVQESEL